MGWAGITNGKLLALAEERFDVFLTGDRKSELSTEPGGIPSLRARAGLKEHETGGYVTAHGQGRRLAPIHTPWSRRPDFAVTRIALNFHFRRSPAGFGSGFRHRIVTGLPCRPPGRGGKTRSITQPNPEMLQKTLWLDMAGLMAGKGLFHLCG
jgi:hypothetical protein